MEHNKTVKILITDDEPKSLYTMEMLLYKEPFEILFAQSGQATLDLVEAEPPDLILLDIMMPDMTGFEVCRVLKSDKRWQHIPIILVTALDRKEDLVRGLEAGADEFLTKPVHGLELRARVRSMLRIKKQHDDLQEALRLREVMADMIIHDMRNPISALVLYTNLMTHRNGQSLPFNELAKKINHQVHRLNSFLGDLLLLAKIGSGKLLLQTTPLNVEKLLTSAATDHQDIADSKGITFKFSLPDKPREFSLDEKLLQRVFANLISNAIKFSPNDSTISLRVSYPESDANSPIQQAGFRAQVIDEGPGIPEEHRERIFDKYEIIEVKHEAIPQIGLGLAMCKMAVEAHGGRIFVEENQPTGAIFTIEI